jgi:hypothetical protein
MDTAPHNLLRRMFGCGCIRGKPRHGFLNSSSLIKTRSPGASQRTPCYIHDDHLQFHNRPVTVPGNMLRSALTKPAALRNLAPSARAVPRRYASHGPTYNEPSGNLFGEKVGNGSLRSVFGITWRLIERGCEQPLPPGQKRKREDWE